MESKLLKSAILRMNNTWRPYPTLFYFPGIRSQSFWKKEDFKSVKILEDNYKIIKEEFQQADLRDVKLENDYKLTGQEHSLHEGSWEWYSYISKGSKMKKFNESFPKTFEILESMDDLVTDIPFAYSFFSKLNCSSSIAPHYGPCNVRLRIHLGLDIPEGCYLKVAEQQRNWEEGKCLVFDDTYLHEVKNENKEKKRVILLLDIWHPDIKLEEREAIIKMFGGAYEKGWLKK